MLRTFQMTLVYRRIYVRKSRFTAPLARRLRTEFPTVYPTITSPNENSAGPRSAVGNVSGYRCVSDCRSRGRELDPGPVPYFRGD